MPDFTYCATDLHDGLAALDPEPMATCTGCSWQGPLASLVMSAERTWSPAYCPDCGAMAIEESGDVEPDQTVEAEWYRRRDEWIARNGAA